MTLSDFRRITDELLSAYIDGQVTEQEAAFIEAAIAQDQEIAWRLNSLRQTVTLLRDLPELALPRSFALTLDQLQVAQPSPLSTETATPERGMVAIPAPMPRMARTPAAEESRSMSLGERLAAGWREFWQAGNPLLRNAAAVSFALMLVLAGSGQLLNRAMQPAGSLVVVPESAPAAASESVAMAPAPTAQQYGAQPETAQANTAASEEAADAAANVAADETADQAADEATEETAAGEAAEESEAEPEAAAMARQAPTDAVPPPTAGEASAAAAMAAPEQPAQSEEIAPLMEMPLPGPSLGVGGMGGGGGGDGTDAPQNGGGGESGLFPEQAYTFDVDPLAAPTTVPAEEAVSVSVAAASAEEAPPASAAAIASTPAVDAPVAAAAAVSDAALPETSDAATDTTSSVARSASPAEAAASTDADTEADSEESEAAQAEVERPVTKEAGSEEAVIEEAAEPTFTPTPEAVALLAPSTITNSAVVDTMQAEGAQEEGVVSATNVGFNLPVVWIAQGSALLLTVVLTSLWWRSRTPRRPRQ